MARSGDDSSGYRTPSDATFFTPDSDPFASVSGRTGGLVGAALGAVLGFAVGDLVGAVAGAIIGWFVGKGFVS